MRFTRAACFWLWNTPVWRHQARRAVCPGFGARSLALPLSLSNCRMQRTVWDKVPFEAMAAGR